MKTYLFLISSVLLTGCYGHTNDELAPWANCQGLNLKFGTDMYEQCIEEQEWRLSEEVQREGFMPMQNYLLDQKKP